ncbi:hypothetical protein MMC14_002027 [Varicellaria rhodocarpa]|nr:hypothetical protein [Varicellaria rhodocarpa]
MARPLALDNQSLIIDTINLRRALQRLEVKIFSSDPKSRLLHSSFERAKVAANLEYARTLLLRLEHSTSGIKVQTRKQTAMNELSAQRTLIKRLNDRLFELGQQDNGIYSDESSGEDILGEDIISTTSKPQEPISSEPTSSPSLSRRKSDATRQPELQIPNPAPSSTLRNRLNPQPSSSSTMTTSSQPQSLSASLLAHNSTEQTTLISSVTALASALKQSQLAFAANLEAEKPLLEMTTQSLDKNADGMVAAEKRMGMLRRMSEGKGWWGRIMLYAWIAGLWVAAILLVFVGPKFRF